MLCTTQLKKTAEIMRKPQLEIVDCSIVIFSSSSFMTFQEKKKQHQRYKMAVKREAKNKRRVKDKETFP